MTTHPPPPAPQAFPPQAPAESARSITRSIAGEETTGASLRRACHSAASAWPIAGKLERSAASAMDRAAIRTCSSASVTRRSPSRRARKISQLFIPEAWAAPVSKSVRCRSHASASALRRFTATRPGSKESRWRPPHNGG